MMGCLLLLNFGEMMFFAFGGIGLYGWSFIGAGIAAENLTVREGRIDLPQRARRARRNYFENNSTIRS